MFLKEQYHFRRAAQEKLRDFLDPNSTFRALLIGKDNKTTKLGHDFMSLQVTTIADPETTNTVFFDLSKNPNIELDLPISGKTVLIIESYEKLEHFENIWLTKKLLDHPDLKIIFTCDTTFLSQQSNFDVYFAPFCHETCQRHLLTTLNTPTTFKKTNKKIEFSNPLALKSTPPSLETLNLNNRIHKRSDVKMQLWADAIKRHSDKSERLIHFYLRIIRASKTNPNLSYAASNAISILILGRVLLSGMDFSNIHAPHANFTGGYFDRTNFSGANLTHANFARAWLRHTTFNDSNLQGASFGIYPHLKIDGSVKSIAYRSDLNLLIATNKHDIEYWDLTRWQKTKILSGHTKNITSLALTKDVKTLISAGEEGAINIWNTESNERHELLGHSGCVNAIALSGDNTMIISGGRDSSVRLWSITQKKEIKRINRTGNFGVRAVAFSEGNQYVAFTCTDNTVKVWDITNDNIVTLIGTPKGCASVTLNQDGSTIVGGGFDGCIGVWTLTSPSKPTLLRGHQKCVYALALSPDGSILASCSDDAIIRLWDIATQTSTLLRGHDNRIYDICFSHDMKQLASASHDSTVRLWDISSAQVEQKTGHQDLVRGVNFSNNGQLIASASSDKLVKIWSVNTGEEIASFKGNTKKVITVHINQSNTHIASGSEDGTVFIWNINTGEQISLKPQEKQINSIYLNATADIVYTGCWDNTIRISNVNTGVTKTLGTHNDKVNCIHLSQDEKVLVSGSVDKTVKVWNLETLELTCTLEGHTFIVISVNISANGRYAISAGVDRNIKVWDLTLQQEIANFTGHKSIIWSTSISRNGEFAASGSADKTIHVWDIKQHKLAAIIRTPRTIMGISIHDTGQIAVGYDDGTVQIWKQLNNSADAWVLSWSSKHFNNILNLANSSFIGAIGLNTTEKTLIRQNKGIVNDNEDILEEKAGPITIKAKTNIN